MPTIGDAFLSEQGITITRNKIIADGATYLFSKISGAHIETTHPGLLDKVLKRELPEFRLIVIEKAIPRCIFETQDAAFAARIADAMGKAAKANSEQRLR